MNPVIGLLQNYEVMLLIVLLLLSMQIKQGSKAIDISVESTESGNLLTDALPATAKLIDSKLEFQDHLYISPEKFIAVLQEGNIHTIALQPAPQTSTTELLDWLLPVSSVGINIQLVQHNNLRASR